MSFFPIGDRVRITVKLALYSGVVAVAALAGLFLFLSGKWKALHRLVLRLGIKKRQIEVDELDAKTRAYAGILANNAEEIEELEARRKQLEKDNLTDKLRIEGMTHEQAVAELRARGM